MYENDSQLKLVIADDHKLLAEAVGTTLRNSDNFDVVVCYDLRTLLKRLAVDAFDIVLLDLGMPDMSGLDSVSKVVQAAGSGFVVLFTGQIDKHVLDKALLLGVRGLIMKTMPLRSVGSILELVQSGQIFLPVDTFITDSVQSKKVNFGLNDKELCVLRLAAEGMTNKEIALETAETEVVVKMHMRAVCKKLGARNRAHAATISLEKSIIAKK